MHTSVFSHVPPPKDQVQMYYGSGLADAAICAGHTTQVVYALTGWQHVSA